MRVATKGEYDFKYHINNRYEFQVELEWPRAHEAWDWAIQRFGQPHVAMTLNGLQIDDEATWGAYNNTFCFGTERDAIEFKLNWC